MAFEADDEHPVDPSDPNMRQYDSKIPSDGLPEGDAFDDAPGELVPDNDYMAQFGGTDHAGGEVAETVDIRTEPADTGTYVPDKNSTTVPAELPEAPVFSKPEDFTPEDVAVAVTAWKTYMHQINGAGLRYDFDYRPGADMQYAERYRQQHFLRYDAMGGLEQSLHELEQMTAAAEHFVGRPVVTPRPNADWYPRVSPIIDRSVDEAAVIFRRFHTALTFYRDALLQHGPFSEEVQVAADSVAHTVNPNAWREAGAPIPEDWQGVTSTGFRWYVEDMLLLTNYEPEQ